MPLARAFPACSVVSFSALAVVVVLGTGFGTTGGTSLPGLDSSFL